MAATLLAAGGVGQIGDRRNKQDKEKKVRVAQAELDRRKAKLEESKDNLEHIKYLADKNESRAEGRLVRMRSGYAEGAKLFFDLFKTQATLTTGSILVIVALSEGLLKTNVSYRPFLWFSYVSLLFSMLATLRTMDIITANVFTTLTSEPRPQSVIPDNEGDVQSRETEAAHNLDALEQKSARSLATLQRRSRWATWSFYAGIGAFALFVAMPPLVDFAGIVRAGLAIAVAALAMGILYRRF